MFRVIDCLTSQHDYRLVGLAALICALASFTAFYVYERGCAARGRKALGWLFLTGFVTGAGIWATHFVAMLAFDPAMPAAYDPVLTALSLLIAMIVTTSGLTLAGYTKARPRFPVAGVVEAAPPRAAWQQILLPGFLVDGSLRKLAGGALLGAGISAMHFTGMRAYILPGAIHWDRPLVIASVAFGMTLGAAAILAFDQVDRIRARVSAAILLTLAICTMHFTAMGAVSIAYDPTIVVAPSLIHNASMAVAIAGVTALVLLAGGAAALIDNQTSQESLTRFRELVEAAIEGLVVAKDGRILVANHRIAELCGFDSHQLAGKAVFGGLIETSAPPPDLSATSTVRAWLKTADGNALPVEVVCRRYDNGIRGNEVYAVRDLRERHAAEARIRHLAHHDTLTDLPNRIALNGVLEDVVRRCAAEKRKFAVLCLDLDGFKDVNDMFGHGVGDSVLRAVAGRLNGVIDEWAFLARTGGDEFVIVQRGKPQPNSAGALAAKLIEALEPPFEIDGQLTQLGVSVGIAIYPDNGDTVEKVQSNADIALYRAKSSGRRQACFFEPEMDAAHRHRRRLAQALHAAIAGDELLLEYQPQFKLPSLELMGFEALVRWQHPVEGLISPGEFIPIAEETGLIVPVGEWVIRRACSDAAQWPKDCKVAVNLSPKQFQINDLVAVVHQALFDSGLAPDRLELEITESTLFADYQRALDILRRLKALGVTIAMDDFGTGYSSLSTLQAFPFDKIKIDRSFIDSLGKHRHAETIVKSVLGLGKSLDIPVLAEGVETPEQLRFLNEGLCQEAQGFYFGAPTALDGVDDIIRKNGVLLPSLPSVSLNGRKKAQSRGRSGRAA